MSRPTGLTAVEFGSIRPVARRGFLGGSVALTAGAVAATLPLAAHAETPTAPAAGDPESVARWDFRLGNAQDLSGHGHHGTSGTGVTFIGDGARLAGTDAGEITVPYAAELQPEAAGSLPLGGQWQLRLTGVRPANLRADHQAVISGRTGNDGWIVYLTPTASIEFWMKQTDPSAGYAKAVSGVRAAAGQSYDIIASWDGARLSIEVTGAATGSGTATLRGRYTPMTPTGPLRLGNGGSRGTEFFFDGTIATAEITVLVPPVDADDAAFFGLWDAAGQRWVVPSRIDYTAAATLAPVEAAVKAADHASARRLLRDHIAQRTERDTLQASYNGTFRPGMVPLFLDHFWTLGTGEIIQDTVTLGTTESTVRADVTDAVLRAVDGGAATANFFLMARHKEASTAVLHSRSASAGQPVLELVAGDGTVTEVPASADTWIRGGSDATTAFGDRANLQVRDEGTGPYGPTTSKAYLAFPLPTGTATTPTTARLRLTGRVVPDAGAATTKEVLVFQTLEDFDETSRTWATTVQNTFSWQGDPGGPDWRRPTGADVEYGYQLPRFYQAGRLADAWVESGDDAIADGLLGLMADFVADADGYGTPYGAGSFPRSLDSAARAINWVYALERVRTSAALDPDRLTAILRTLDKSGQYLATATHPTPNWMQTQKQALAAIAIHFPEFVDSTAWRQNAADYLSGMLAEVLYADGGYAEAADGYAYGVAGTAAAMQAHFAAAGHPLGGREDLHRLVTFLADQTLPGGWGVGYGDSGTADRRRTLAGFADLFDDAALRHIATDGTDGAPPDHTSVRYPDTRVAVLRDGWTPAAAYLRINADRGAHSHPDNLAVTVQAHGRQLLPELGAFTYSSDPRSTWLRRSTAAQTTVEVDGTAQSLTADGGIPLFSTNPVFDVVSAWTQGAPTVRHTRTVLFVRTEAARSAFWVVSDQLRPDDGGHHTYRQHWHFLPGAAPVADSTGAVFTGFGSGANLLLAPAATPDLQVELGDGFHSPRFYSVTTNRHARMSRTASGPVVLDTLLQPTADPVRPRTTVVRVPVTGAGAGDAGAMAVDFGRGRTAHHLVSHIGAGHRLGFGPCEFDGILAWVERDTIRTSWLLHGGRTLVVDGEQVVASPVAFADLAVRFNPRRAELLVDGTGLVPSTDPARAIRITVPAGRVVLNGTEVPYRRISGAVLAVAVG